MKKRILIGVFVIIMSVFFASCGQEEPSSTENLKEQRTEKVFSSFTTEDILGNSVDESIFKNNKYTVVDVWGTFCNPCIESLPEMEKLYQKYKSQEVGVVGMVVDVQDNNGDKINSNIETAKYITETQKVTYTNMLIPKEANAFMEQITSIPTGFIVDSHGNVVSELYVGAKTVDQWSEIIDEKLAE